MGSESVGSNTDKPAAMPGTRRSRRVQVPAVPGTDPAPQYGLEVTRAAEDTDAAWGDNSESNDSDLKRNKPPHWG